MDVDEVRLDCRDHHRHQNLFAQLTKLFDSHIVLVCALTVPNPMLGNIAPGDTERYQRRDIAEHMRPTLLTLNCRDEPE